MLSEKKRTASLGQQCKMTESTDQKWGVSQEKDPEQDTLSQTYYQEVPYLDSSPTTTNLLKITDMLQKEAQ